MVGQMIRPDTSADLLLGMWLLLQLLGRVPRRLIWDTGPASVGRRLAEGLGAFTGTLATTPQRLEPYGPSPRASSNVRNGFLETFFMPGRDLKLGDLFQGEVEWTPLQHRFAAPVAAIIDPGLVALDRRSTSDREVTGQGAAACDALRACRDSNPKPSDP